MKRSSSHIKIQITYMYTPWTFYTPTLKAIWYKLFFKNTKWAIITQVQYYRGFWCIPFFLWNWYKCMYLIHYQSPGSDLGISHSNTYKQNSCHKIVEIWVTCVLRYKRKTFNLQITTWLCCFHRQHIYGL